MNTHSPRILAGAALAAALLSLSACGGSSGSGSGKTSDGSDAAGAAKDACALTTKETVQKITGGTVADGKPSTSRNCEYDVTGGSVEKIDVYSFGTADDFDEIRSGYESNRGGTTDISGIGKAAYSPKDLGENEVVVEAGNAVFAVAVPTISADKVFPEVKALATAIAAELG